MTSKPAWHTNEFGTVLVERGHIVLVTEVVGTRAHYQLYASEVGQFEAYADVQDLQRRPTPASAPSAATAARTAGPIRVRTVEEFIELARFVEDLYPNASPGEVASELRQIWYYEAGWRGFINSDGIEDEGHDVNLESETHPIAAFFDIRYLRRESHSGTVATPFGEVALGHVIAGIDARINGAAPPRGARRDRLSPQDRFAYDLAVEAVQGRAREFSTWACDFGDAYAHAMHGTPASVALASKAGPAELAGDLDGYVAVDVVAQHDHPGPVAGQLPVSEILRLFYSLPPDVHRDLTAATFDHAIEASGDASAATAIERCSPLVYKRITLAPLRDAGIATKALAYSVRYDLVEAEDDEFAKRSDRSTDPEIQVSTLVKAFENFAHGSCYITVESGVRHAVVRGVPDLIRTVADDTTLLPCTRDDEVSRLVHALGL